MDFLLFSGPPQAGKTPSIREYARYLHLSSGYNIIDPPMYTIPATGDIKCILEKGNRKIMIASETDQVTSTNELYLYYQAHPDVNAIITAARDEGDGMRTYLFSKMDISNVSNFSFEIPLGRMVRGWRRSTAFTWYLDSILQIAKKVGALPPFYL